MTKNKLAWLIGTIIMAVYFGSVVVALIIGPQDLAPKYPPQSDPDTLPYDARYPGLTVDY